MYSAVQAKFQYKSNPPRNYYVAKKKKKKNLSSHLSESSIFITVAVRAYIYTRRNRFNESRFEGPRAVTSAR